MNTKGQEDPELLASRVGAESPCSDMKRAAARKLIQRYFYQLIDGCGNPHCDNQYCASSGKVTNLTRNEAAAQAIHLFSQEVKLCDGTQPSKVPKTSIESNPESLAKSVPQEIMNTSCSTDGTSSSSPSPNKILQHDVSIQFPSPKSSTSTVQIFPTTTPGNPEPGDCLHLQLDSCSASLHQSLPATIINSPSSTTKLHHDISIQFPTPKSSDSTVQIFPSTSRDNQEQSDCLQLSFDSARGSLAKKYPRIIRPSYPTDAPSSSSKIQQHDVSIQFPTPKSSTSTIQSFPNNTTEDCLQLSDMRMNKTRKRVRSNQSPQLRKSKRKVHCNCMRNISLSRGSDSDCSVIIDSPSSTQCSNASITLLKSPSFERLLKAYNTNLTKKRGRKPKQQKKNIKRKTIKKRAKKSKKINKLRMNNNDDDDDDDDVVDDISRKDAVAELIVLALYLRYLESKKYS